jgi:FlaA1/EpsC-like NDP-sugar epimerase
MRIAITGSAGSIGSALAERIYRKQHKDLLLIDMDETGIFYISSVLRGADCLVSNITNKKRLFEIFKQYKPEIVFHCAAYKHVPLMEKQKDEAIENNIYGTKNVIEASIRYGVKKFIFVSTDKAVEPVSVMGKTKEIGEKMCCAQRSKTQFIIVRFGNVLYSRGSVIPTFEKIIAENGTIEVTSPSMERYFIKMQDALTLILKAAEGKDKQLFVWDMGKPKLMIDVARELVEKSGKKIKIVITEPRPGEKTSEKLFNEWEKPIKKGKLFVTQLPYKKIDLKKLIKKI